MDLKDTIQSLRRFDLESLFNTFLGLPPRQQTTALVGIGVALLLIVVLPVSIAAGRLGSLEKQIAEAREGVDTVVTEIQRYQELKTRLEGIEGIFKRQSADLLLTVIERIGSEAGVTVEQLSKKPAVVEENYEEERASFQLKKIALPQLVKFLNLLESSPQKIVRIKELITKPVYGNRKLLNAEFREVAAYKLVQEEK